MSGKSLLIASITLLTLAAGSYLLLNSSDPPKTVDHVDLSRYVGKWYEVASIPMFFAWGCNCSTAEYSANNDSTIKVNNTCKRLGKFESAIAKAWTTDQSNSKLKVEFFWPFKADYWIVDLDKDYEWAVISNPKKSYLWILNRKPIMEDGLYNSLIEKLKNEGFPVDKLNKDENKNCWA